MTNTNGFDDFDTQVTAEEFYDGWTEDEADYYQEHAMQTELEQVITEFTIKMRDRYKTDSYAAGYFSAWVRQFGEADPKVARTIIRQLNYSMEICK